MPDPYAPPSDDRESSKLGAILAPYKPIMSKLTISSVMGYCTAITAKRVGKGIAFIAGLGFIALQGMVYSGFVTVDWKKVEKTAVDALDTVSSFCRVVGYSMSAGTFLFILVSLIHFSLLLY
jgi:uncharacterized membrane protein (Fun14 family)